jgi:hypothetical protein
MSARRTIGALCLVVASAIVVPAAAAQVAATAPDAKQYPVLASLLDWLKSNAKDARNCSATVAMTLSARAAYEKTRSDAEAAEALARGLVAQSKGAIDEPRAKLLADGYVRTAQQFMPLPAQAAGIAIAQLCRSAVERADRPFADGVLVQRLVADSRACTSSGFVEKASNYVPLECVAKTMSRR